MVKAAVLAGGGEPEADYALSALAAEETGSPTASYARAIAALIVGDDDGAAQSAAGMRTGAGAFGRTADAIDALANHDQAAYSESLRSIVRDFEDREAHLTGVRIADTGLMLERLAERRGMAAAVDSPVLPAQAR
jgi:hypothetical protein